MAFIFSSGVPRLSGLVKFSSRQLPGITTHVRVRQIRYSKCDSDLIMWFFILFSGFASAQGAGFSDVKMSAPSHVVQVDSTPTRGKLALENAIRSLGFQTKDVEVIEIDYRRVKPHFLPFLCNDFGETFCSSLRMTKKITKPIWKIM